MSRPRALVTGSSDGIGATVADALAAEGYDVVRHARSTARAEDCLARAPEGTRVVVGDLASVAETRQLADQLSGLGPFEAIVHNAGTAAPPARRRTRDGIELTLQVNAIAPYVLTALMPAPVRLVYVGSDAIRHADLDLEDIQSTTNWDASSAYARSKIALTAMGIGVARRWPSVLTTVVHPGWVRSKMSGETAPLSLEEGADTVVWLALGNDAGARMTGELYFERRPVRLNDQVYDPEVQDAVLTAFEQLTGVALPATAPARIDDYG